jgi:hypothetical protein
LFCSSCGHENPRENRYCGMCGTPFPHRLLTVPDAQSTLTFSSAPIVITPSQLPAPAAAPPQPPPKPVVTAVPHDEPAPLENTLVEHPPTPVTEERSVAAATVPAVESAPVVDAPLPAAAPVIELAEPLAAPEETPAEVSKPAPAAKLIETTAEQTAPVSVVADAAPPLETPRAVPQLQEAPPSPPVEAELAPSSPAELHDTASRPAPPEVAEPTSPAPPPSVTPSPRKPPPPRAGTADRRPSVIQRLPALQPIPPPPASAGMPTFKSVAEASGPPVSTPFEIPEARDPNEERELQEFVAGFRYTPPDESFDELTMRSEVPVIDKEAPVTPSHPSFDDDVPPPPEAGPHPTGEEYYPPPGLAAGRSRFLDIAETHPTGAGRGNTTTAGTSFLGLDGTLTAATPPLDEVGQPSRVRWLFWTSLVAALAIFGGLGFLEGRAQINHTNQGPIEIIVQQYQKLRQRMTMGTATAPAAPASIADKQAEDTPKPTVTPAQPSGTDQPNNAVNTNPPATPETQPALAPDQPQPQPSTPPQSITAENHQPTATPLASPSAATQQKPIAEKELQPAPVPGNAAAKVETARPIEPPVPKSSSTHEPGQQELAKAMEASDPAVAAAWLWKATSRGNPTAPVRLADMYIKGKGVPHSCEQALVLLRSAAIKENAPARNRLASLYANGTCVARDRVKAYQLMSSALVADPGSDWAQQNREELWQQMTPQERSQAEKYR